MKQEEKKILLKDLSARLPYGVYCKIDGIEEPKKLTGIEVDEKNGHLLNFGVDEDTQLLIQVYLSEVRPYLRPTSNMTNDEVLQDYNNYCINNVCERFDLYNSHHLDYRGLIDKGLALEAKEGMYNNENVV